MKINRRFVKIKRRFILLKRRIFRKRRRFILTGLNVLIFSMVFLSLRVGEKNYEIGLLFSEKERLHIKILDKHTHKSKADKATYRHIQTTLQR